LYDFNLLTGTFTKGSHRQTAIDSGMDWPPGRQRLERKTENNSPATLDEGKIGTRLQ